MSRGCVAIKRAIGSEYTIDYLFEAEEQGEEVKMSENIKTQVERDGKKNC